MIIFETDRLLVRLLKEEDLDNFDAINGDPEVMRYIRTPKSREENRAFLLENILAYERRPQQGRWAVILKETGDFVGTFAVIPIEDRYGLQLGYALLKPYWGRGFASELTRAGIEYVFRRMLLQEIWAITETENKSSQKVLEKTGFIRKETFLHTGKTVYLYRLGANEIPLESKRLRIMPLNHKRLLQYLKAEGYFEKDNGLPYTGRTISRDVKEMVDNFTMPKIKSASDDDYLFYSFWVVINKSTGEIVAELGFKGPPDEEGRIEIGYGTMPEQENRGYMSEAVATMLQWGKENPRVRLILAETDQSNQRSIRVLQKNGFIEFERKGNMIWWKAILS
jgi:ribosomal-protein-alanine N-acetyltransferase